MDLAIGDCFSHAELSVGCQQVRSVKVEKVLVFDDASGNSSFSKKASPRFMMTLGS